MMKKVVIFPFIFLLILIALFLILRYSRSCRINNLSDYAYTIKSGIEKGAKLSDFITFERKIALQLPDSIDFIELGESRSIALVDTFLIIVSREFHRIFVFDSFNGKLITCIARKGEGPGEYLSIDYFDVSEDRLLYIYDRLKLQFLVFDLNGNFKKAIKLKERIPVKHFCVRFGKIFVHHPPIEEYAGFVSIIDSTGKVLNTIQNDIRWGYRAYFYRGFLSGDVYICGNGLVIESNLFSPYIYIGDTTGNFKKGNCKITDFAVPPKTIKDDPSFYRSLKLPYLGEFIVNEEMGIVMQSYVPPNVSRKVEHLYYNVFDFDGNYIGRIVGDVFITSNLGDNKYILGLDLGLRSGREPKYNLIVYRWKKKEEISI
jgi:hypothetical protein